MIAGIGTDIVDVDAFRQQVADPASVFASGTFTTAERQAAASRPGTDEVPHLAARFAAKEAFVKAWSSGNYGCQPTLSHVDMREIEVASDRHGRPALRLHGDVADALQASGPYRIHVSLSHDGPTAAAFVVVEQVQR